MADSANDIIRRAMVKARIISPGESIPASKANQVLEELNDMLDSWSIESLMIPCTVLESFSLIVGQSEYTYGTGGDFDSSRPTKVWDDAFVRSGTTDYRVKKYPLNTYRGRDSKSTGGRPEMFAVNPEFPLLRVLLYPTPSSIDSIYFKSDKLLTSFSSLTTEVTFGPGYRRAIVANLALEITPNFGKKASKELIVLATMSLSAIKGKNSTVNRRLNSNSDFRVMMRGRGGYNILSGS